MPGQIVSFRSLGILPLLPAALQPQIKKGHKAAGILVWLLGLVTIELALGKPTMQVTTVSSLRGCSLLLGLMRKEFNSKYTTRYKFGFPHNFHCSVEWSASCGG